MATRLFWPLCRLANPMKIETANNRFFSLTVERYEFPDEELGPTEYNPADEFETGRFLVVSHGIRNADGEWNTRGPTMTTNELQRFVDWLNLILNGSPPTDGIYFTERDLEFTYDASARNLCVHLFRDFLPPWIGSADHVTIEFSVNEIDLESAINSLQSQLDAFPGRPPIRNAT